MLLNTTNDETHAGAIRYQNSSFLRELWAFEVFIKSEQPYELLLLPLSNHAQFTKCLKSLLLFQVSTLKYSSSLKSLSRTVHIVDWCFILNQSKGKCTDLT